MPFKLGLIFLAVLPASVAQAFTLMPSAGIDETRWRDFPIVFRFNPAHAAIGHQDARNAIAEALSLWNAVPGSILKAELGEDTARDAANFLAGSVTDSAIVFDPALDQHLPGVSGSVLAVGKPYREGDRYVRGVILINAKAKLSFEALRSAVAHEVGHVFGLGHTQDRSALMHPTLKRMEALSQDDALGIEYLYPRKDVPGSAGFGCASLSSRVNKRPPPSAMAVGMMLGLVCLSWFSLRLKVERA